MNLTDKIQIGKEVSQDIPTATEPTHAVPLQQVEEIAGASEGTGTDLDLSNTSGTNYNYGAASSATTYTTSNPSVNGFASCLINAASEPTVTGATKISGATFTANTDMEMIVESKDGTNVRYFFLSL